MGKLYFLPAKGRRVPLGKFRDFIYAADKVKEYLAENKPELSIECISITFKKGKARFDFGSHTEFFELVREL